MSRQIAKNSSPPETPINRGDTGREGEEINRDLLQLIELGESLHAIFVVDDATGFAATVHSEDGIAHIHTLQWDGRGEDIAQCTATCHITMVHETLAWYTGCIANVGEDGC